MRNKEADYHLQNHTKAFTCHKEGVQCYKSKISQPKWCDHLDKQKK